MFSRTKKTTLNQITFVTKKETAGSIRLSAIHQNDEIGHALYEEGTNGGVYLNWIETKEQFQNKGVASILLNHICSLTKDKNTFLEINVVDEEVLNGFYLKWFQKKFDPEHKFMDKIKAKFNEIIMEGDIHPAIRFTLEDLSWQPSSGRTLSL